MPRTCARSALSTARKRALVCSCTPVSRLNGWRRMCWPHPGGRFCRALDAEPAVNSDGALCDHDRSRIACAADYRPLEAISRGSDSRRGKSGKTTLANSIASSVSDHNTRFDLENPSDLARLADAMLALKEPKGLIVLDEEACTDLHRFLPCGGRFRNITCCRLYSSRG